MNHKNKFILLIFTLTILCIISIGCVSAAENMNTSNFNANSNVSINNSQDNVNLEISNNQKDTNYSLKSTNQITEENRNENIKLSNSTLTNTENNILTSFTNIYISPQGNGTGFNANNPTNWDNAYYNIVDGGTITFTNGTYNIINQTISKNLTLQSDFNSNVILNAQHKGFIFKISEGTLTLNSLTLANGTGYKYQSADYSYLIYGGAIFLNQGTINNINCVYVNNTAEIGGGICIFNYGTINNTNTNYTHNTAINGGAISILNGTIINNGVNFNNNIAKDTAGAIYTENCNISNIHTNYINNKANWTGGAINIRVINEIDDSTGNIINFNTNYINNTATEDSGGAITIGYGSKSDIKNINTYYINNSAGHYGMSHGGTGGETPGNGGAIYIEENCNIVNINSYYINNTAYGTYGGGAIYNWGSGKVINNNSQYINNKADGNGGAISIRNTITNLNSTFINNTAGHNGVIIYNEEELYPTPETFITFGGAINSGNSTNINSTFINNIAGYGGAISVGEELQEEYLPPEGYILNNYNTTFINNTALKNNGGAIYTCSGNITNSFSTYNNNIANDGSGSAIFLFYGNIKNTYSIYVNNKAHDGQTINIKTGNLTNINTTFINNTQIKSGIYGENLTMIYGTQQNYTGKLIGNNGEPLIGQHVAIKLSNSQGQNKIYYATTDSNGEYQLEINLYPGTYTAISSYDKYSCTNNIKVLKEVSNLTSTTLTANPYQEHYGIEGNFTGKLTVKNGKALIGQHIALKLSNSQGQSKIYYSTTDVNGEYQLAINLYPGQYYAECTYAGTSVYDSSTNSATITVTN